MNILFSRLNKMDLSDYELRLILLLLDLIPILYRVTIKQVKNIKEVLEKDKFEEIKKYIRIQNDYVNDMIIESAKKLSGLSISIIVERMENIGSNITEKELIGWLEK